MIAALFLKRFVKQAKKLHRPSLASLAGCRASSRVIPGEAARATEGARALFVCWAPGSRAVIDGVLPDPRHGMSAALTSPPPAARQRHRSARYVIGEERQLTLPVRPLRKEPRSTREPG